MMRSMFSWIFLNARARPTLPSLSCTQLAQWAWLLSWIHFMNFCLASQDLNFYVPSLGLILKPIFTNILYFLGAKPSRILTPGLGPSTMLSLNTSIGRVNHLQDPCHNKPDHATKHFLWNFTSFFIPNVAVQCQAWFWSHITMIVALRFDRSSLGTLTYLFLNLVVQNIIHDC